MLQSQYQVPEVRSLRIALPVVLGGLGLSLLMAVLVLCLRATVRRARKKKQPSHPASAGSPEELLAPLLEANAQGVSEHSDAIRDQAIERRNSEMSNTLLTTSTVINGIKRHGFANPLYMPVDELAIPENFSEVPKITNGKDDHLYRYPDLDESELLQCGNKIDRNNVRIVGHLGSGQFGIVEKGVWKSPFGPKDVAVKTLNPGAPGNDRIRFLKEAAIMGQFSHPNVVEMYGIVTNGEPIMIVIELLLKSDLRNYLMPMRSSITKSSVAPPIEATPTDALPFKLLGFCRQIASGMCYLANKGFVHRDLAARNILVSADDQCKIADFGMSRDLEDENYYISHGGKIPVKWTAPEAIYYKKYSTASDVWSFGCVMYEIWSLGCKPFESYPNDKVLKLLDENYRLPPPPGCTRAIYDLMIQCWHPSRSDRPTFVLIHQTLSLSDTKLLRWSSEDRDTHPQATLLGAPLEGGQNLHLDLQRKYL